VTLAMAAPVAGACFRTADVGVAEWSRGGMAGNGVILLLNLVRQCALPGRATRWTIRSIPGIFRHRLMAGGQGFPT